MDDTRPELESHLGFMRQAEGRVLVTGLGLGCVVRGLLAKRSVTAVTVIEKSADVLKLVKPHMPRDEHLEIIHADALTWAGQTDRTFDYAWHDLWTDRTKGEPHLALWHTRLLLDMRDKVTRQGAWDYPRWTRQFLAAKCGIELVR